MHQKPVELQEEPWDKVPEDQLVYPEKGPDLYSLPSWLANDHCLARPARTGGETATAIHRRIFDTPEGTVCVITGEKLTRSLPSNESELSVYDAGVDRFAQGATAFQTPTGRVDEISGAAALRGMRNL